MKAISASSTARPIRATAAMRVNLSMEPSPKYRSSVAAAEIELGDRDAADGACITHL
jgi:hypothetical protein